MPHLTRRTFLAVATLLGSVGRAFGRQRRGAARTITRDEFLHLSEALVGRSGLDAGVSATYLDALLAVPGNGAGLYGLLSRSGPLTAAERDLERTIVECWYTGTYTVRGERRVATHTGALMWTALGVSPPSICGGLFGAWSQAPPRR